ncbi:DNA repair protein RadA [Rickettsia endosymbiont of Cardiosporidium cionae]|uniref:DNA repair protein RadA n=1 Tax=Rickettsia endosymbiont of Cardiosporidium cionae TaxID=2777155 RepID=UPI00389A02DF|nr:DNA repair protein RadA [Rickettsia endosymbiont of Cardiosporidium cionae]
MKKQYICSNCGNVVLKWSGQCIECGVWGSIAEEILNNKNEFKKLGDVKDISYLNKCDIKSDIKIQTSITEFNRVIGGGIVNSSVILIGGDPGIGKSTLLLQVATNLSTLGVKSLYITGEESLEQVVSRSQRLKISNDQTAIINETNLENIVSTIEYHKSHFKLFIIDSIQTIVSNKIPAAAGTISQIKFITNILINYIKLNNIALIISCHINKEGQFAGPKILEHMVDTVLYFEGDHHNHYRILRSIKNRFGNISEIGVFEMTSQGLIEVPNPSELFLTEQNHNISGNAIFAAVEGSRPLLIEIQALISSTNMATPRRSVVGWDYNRLAMIIAVLNIRLKINLSFYEIYLNVAGGIKITEPAADLAVAAALISAYKDVAIPQKVVFFGEIGLSGIIKKVSQSDARIKECKKLGFKQIYCQVKDSDLTNKKDIISLTNLTELKKIFYEREFNQ